MPVLRQGVTRPTHFGVSGEMGLEVGGLSESLGAARLRTGVRTVPRMDTEVGAEIEIEREPLTASLR